LIDSIDSNVVATINESNLAKLVASTAPGSYMTFVPTGGTDFDRAEYNNDGSVSLVCRELTRLLLDQLRERMPKSRVVMLDGAGGTGKTTLVRLVAEHFRQQEGFVVIHIENDATDPQTWLECALAEPHFAPDSGLRTEIDAALRDTKCTLEHRAELALEVLDWLKWNARVAVLIDRYNEFYELDYDDAISRNVISAPPSVRFIRQMRRFSRTAQRIVHSGGVFVAAVSSSFSPLGTEAFTDDLRGQLTRTVKVFSDEERRHWLTWHRERDLLPADLDDDEICERAAHVPRMLSFFDRRNVTNLYPDRVYTKAIAIYWFEKRANYYYDQQVLSVLRFEDRGSTGESRHHARQHHAFLLQLILHDRFSQGLLLPARWSSSGMIIATREYDAWQFVCPSALDAVIRYCQRSLMSSIKLLASDALTKWRAFELFFTAQFLRATLLRLPNQGITRVKRSQALVDLHTTTFQRMPVPTDDRSPIEPGTLVVLDTQSPDFASIDFFAHSTNGLRFFIQLWPSTYSQYTCKIDLLFKKQAYLGGKSTFQFFAERTNLTPRPRSNASSLPDTCFFVYLCNKADDDDDDNPAHRKMIHKKHKDRIIYLTKHELQSFGGDFQYEGLYA